MASIKQLKSGTRPKTTKSFSKVDISGEEEELRISIEVKGAETVIKDLEDDYDVFKKSKDSAIYKQRLALAKKIAKDYKDKEQKEIKEKEEKERNIEQEVISTMTTSSEKAKKRLEAWIKAINDAPTPKDLQKKVTNFLGGEYKEWEENSPIVARFENQEKILLEKINPVINNIKPYYDMIMGIYNMKIDIDSVVKVVTQVVLAQFAPFIDKYNQYSHTVNEVTSITKEVNLLKSAIEKKANEFGVATYITLPNVPSIPVLPSIPLSFDDSSSSDKTT